MRLQANYLLSRALKQRVLPGVLLCLIFYAANASAKLTLEKMDDAVYAYVGEQAISLDEYKQSLQGAVKGKFYHGKIPEGKMEEVQRDTGKELITNILMLQEAQRRKYTADKKYVEETLAATVKNYEQQYGNSEKWPEYKARFVPNLKAHLEKKSIVEKLEEDINKAPVASVENSKQYYFDNKEKFTSPEQLRVSIILLQVMPSSPVAAWDEAMAEGVKIYKKLQNGSDFSELAKLHSADASAENGGDLGYLHKGMLAKKIQDVIDDMKSGEISKPMEVLRGITIFRLEDRKEPVLNSFEKVKDRAGRLWQREQAGKAKDEFIKNLWDSSEVRVNTKYYKEEMVKPAVN